MSEARRHVMGQQVPVTVESRCRRRTWDAQVDLQMAEVDWCSTILPSLCSKEGQASIHGRVKRSGAAADACRRCDLGEGGGLDVAQAPCMVVVSIHACQRPENA